MYVSAFSQYCISYSVRKSGMECNLVIWWIVIKPSNFNSINHLHVRMCKVWQYDRNLK